MSVRRIYVEKMEGLDVAASGLLADIKENLGIKGLEKLRILIRYDVENISDDIFNKAKTLIFSEPNVDYTYEDTFDIPSKARVFAVEYLPGQFDQRADSASQCVQILTQGLRPNIKAATVYVLSGDISDEDVAKIKNYCINPVESREASSEIPETLDMQLDVPTTVATVEGFIESDDAAISDIRKKYNINMSVQDLSFCRDYFKNEEKRNPTITEIKVIDTYWSDHCRHTTFLTRLNNISVENELVKEAFNEYLKVRSELYAGRNKDVSLMDIATIGGKYLKKTGKATNLDESEEINACSIKVKADINGQEQDYLIMFKNETHNHPTEIEPFGGAATCLGGAIRDPLSGRSYVYQAMRVTGSADPTVPVSATIKGKLPQRKITTGAAAGYSSYGNQIGLATGHVREIYHPGYMAKRMEIGAVIAAAPAENVIRERPDVGDVIILLGGRTGRDGIGGATGSSKEHTTESVTTCGSEVQKGNAPTERKLQRLFRNPNASRLIKRCNDFGAGGVCVAIGELAPALDINLDLVLKKYEGLDGTELAISESQERMAVVVASKDADKFMELAGVENLESVKVAHVTDTGRLKMTWNGNTIVNISREFLDTNGVTQESDICVSASDSRALVEKAKKGKYANWHEMLRSLECASQKGLEERFDSTIGAGTVLMPYGGKYQMSPQDGMAAKIPLEKGDTTTGTIMTFGYDPYISEADAYLGSIYAVISSLAKHTAIGGLYSDVRLTFQEYFEKLGTKAQTWGKPFAALLGGLHAQLKIGIPAIGGKDSMSGTFENIHVPPTLCSFAVSACDVRKVISTEFKNSGSNVIVYSMPICADGMPDMDNMMTEYANIHELIGSGKIVGAKVVERGGIARSICMMAFGNKYGFTFDAGAWDKFADNIFDARYGDIVLELAAGQSLDSLCLDKSVYTHLGTVTDNGIISAGNCEMCVQELLDSWRGKLDRVFPELGKKLDVSDSAANIPLVKASVMNKSKVKIAKPRVFIPVFPGTNCEYDTAKAFENAGAQVETLVFRNITASDIEETVTAMTKLINNSQIVMLPGGFSAGDEPEGSGKFIATVFRNPAISEAVSELLKNRDGLMLGICNGFQALIKLGLVPYGEIKALDKKDPTLTFNTIGRHISRYAFTRVTSNKSPWLWATEAGDVHAIPISHGEGRFIADDDVLAKLIANGQIATQYVDESGNVSMDPLWNPNGSCLAIEGITSADGRVLGKMGHSERKGASIGKNIPYCKDQKLFESGVAYFK
ncbi:MAG: phosphoribosylformylglycinamidine synthase [Clostridia bacterium]|nr:phosphoribosylformylglycinamidine synthase [Clostridia bacterium]